MTKLSRRDFLKLSIDALLGLGGLIGIAGLVRFFSYEPDPGRPTEFDLGDASAFPDGSRTLRPDIPAAIYNRGGEFSACSLICTHLGCTIEADGEDAFLCPCHGSRYDRDGKVLAGPAQSPLPKLRVERLPDNTLRLHMRSDG
jgi:Rieske Fe-S protein